MKRRSPCKILFIEPEQENQFILSEILEANGCMVDAVDNIGDGIELSRKYKYHIIICQNNLPDSSGLQVYKTIKDDIIQTGTAFFLLLNRIENRDFFTGLELGIDNFIELPINKDVLINKIMNQIEKSRAFDVFVTEKFIDYFNTSPVAMFIIEENEIVEINKSFRDLFKGQLKNLQNTNFYEILRFGGEPENIAKYYKLKKGNSESCILKNIKFIDSFIFNFEIFLYKSNSDKKGKIIAEILPSDSKSEKMMGLKWMNETYIGTDENEEIKTGTILGEINFTDREYEVYKLSAQGLPIKQIASRLSLSNRTVEKHRQNIMKKTNACNIIEAIRNFQKTHSLFSDQDYDVE